jgi:L-ribulose-5-phosphate 4-epimerase
MLEALKEEVCRLHSELTKNNLVSWTSGNISARFPSTNLVVIKPSGVKYEELTPEKMVVVDLNGNIIEGDLNPSVDCPSHLYVYRHRPDVHGIVHTHSPYATAFAAIGEAIPPVLTAIADEFGGPIPCSGYAKIGEEEVGREIIKTIGTSKAVLLRQHGVFTIGSTAENAVKTAVMTEDAAKTVYLAKQLGTVEEIPEEELKRAHQRYVEKYGQNKNEPAILAATQSL